MHWKRWLTAIVIIPPLIVLTLKAGTFWFAIAMMAISILALWEYFRIVSHGHSVSVPTVLPALLLIPGVLVIWSVYKSSLIFLIALLALTIVGSGFFAMLRFKNDEQAPFIMVKQVFGLIYIPLLLSFLVLLHQSPNGAIWVVFVFWVVALSDTGALYTGTYLGRRKLIPSVSPNKTVEGSIGGLMASILLGWCFKLVFIPELTALACLMFTCCVSLAGQVGDLFESLFKRAGGVKDSGSLLPGHGGILDRIDAVLFAAPVAYLLKELLLS